MRKILILMMLIVGSVAQAQLPYSWTNGNNPGWSASNNSDNTLSWQPGVGAVSTSNFTSSWQSYSNNQNTRYTSPTRNMTCPETVRIHVSMELQVNLEPNGDFLYFDYSQNGGATWTQIASWTSTFVGVQIFDLPESTNARFRFRFISDGSVNSYCSDYHWLLGCRQTSIYYADILNFSVTCITYLPVELLSFDAKRDGTSVRLDWSTASETNNDYFEIERSFNGYNWDVIQTVEGQGNTTLATEYMRLDRSNKLTGIIYYRLSQTDFDGKQTTFDIKSVYMGDRKIVKIINVVGQEVDINTKGLIILIYSNGEQEKIIN